MVLFVSRRIIVNWLLVIVVVKDRLFRMSCPEGKPGWQINESQHALFLEVFQQLWQTKASVQCVNLSAFFEKVLL